MGGGALTGSVLAAHSTATPAHWIDVKILARVKMALRAVRFRRPLRLVAVAGLPPRPRGLVRPLRPPYRSLLPEGR